METSSAPGLQAAGLGAQLAADGHASSRAVTESRFLSYKAPRIRDAHWRRDRVAARGAHAANNSGFRLIKASNSLRLLKTSCFH